MATALKQGFERTRASLSAAAETADAQDAFKKDVKKLDDIIALIALYRPGPMELIPEYVKAKKGLTPIKYLHPLLEDQGDRLSTEELTANVTFLFTAGYDTTTNLIGNGLLALFRHPDQLAMLRNNPSLIGNAVEEFLRYDASVQISSRAALEDVTLGDRIIAKGGAVLCAMGGVAGRPR
jgi:hypothetical protein